MRDYETGLTQEELKRILDYDPDTGIFTWRTWGKGRNKNLKAGTKRFYSQSEHGKVNYPKCRTISINHFDYQAHRLAWLYMKGEWPNIVDHYNRNPHDNRWCNLKNGTQLQNCRNKSISSLNTSGVTGVYWDKNRGQWKASISVNNKTVNLGRFKELHDAVSARRKAEKEHSFHPKHGKRSA